MVDADTKAEWEKSKRIEAEKQKASQDLSTRKDDKSGLAYLPPEKAHSFSRDPDVIMKSAERMANISIVFAPLGVLFSFFRDIFSIISQANRLGLAGDGMMMILGAVCSIGLIVAIITGVIALVCTIIFAKRTKRKVKHIIITASISLTLIVIYFFVRSLIMRMH